MSQNYNRAYSNYPAGSSSGSSRSSLNTLSNFPPVAQAGPSSFTGYGQPGPSTLPTGYGQPGPSTLPTGYGQPGPSTFSTDYGQPGPSSFTGYGQPGPSTLPTGYGQPGPSTVPTDYANQVMMPTSQGVELEFPPHFKWDVSLPPENAKVNGTRIAPESWQQEATIPPMQSLTIRIPSSLLNHMITVTPSVLGGNVTIGDVLTGVYRYFRQPVQGNTLTRMDQRTRQSVDHAYQKRCERLSGNSVVCQQEMLKGLKYVDLLLGHTRWKKLSAIEPGVAKLSLSSS